MSSFVRLFRYAPMKLIRHNLRSFFAAMAAVILTDSKRVTPAQVLFVIDTKLLGVSFSNEPSLILDTVSLAIPLDIINPHRFHDVRSSWRFNEVPHMFSLQCVHFSFHRDYLPVRVGSHCVTI